MILEKPDIGFDFEIKKINGVWDIVQKPKERMDGPSKKVKKLFGIIEDNSGRI